MSQQNLKRYLEKLYRELESKDMIKDFRGSESNVKTHIFKVSRADVVQALREQLDSDGIRYMPDELLDIAGTFMSDMNSVLATTNFQSKVHKRSNTKDLINATFYASEGKDIFAIIARSKKKASVNMNSRLKQLYEDSNEWFFRQANTKDGELRFNTVSTGLVTPIMHTRDVTDITHSSLSVVTRQAVTKTQNKLDSYVSSKSELNNIQKELSIDLSLVKNDKARTIMVSVGSSFSNREQGRTLDKSLKTAASNKLLRAIATLEGLENLTGSDSMLSALRKRVISKVMGIFRKSPSTKVTTEDTKIKVSSAKPVVKRIKPNVTAGKSVSMAGMPDIRTPTVNTRKSVISLQSLVPQINARLAETIRGNMGSPALNWREGRFGGSVKVLNISNSNNLTYTYMRYPYETFEPGGAQGSVARDPRPLIEDSIREVAIMLTKEKFNMRRV